VLEMPLFMSWITISVITQQPEMPELLGLQEIINLRNCIISRSCSSYAFIVAIESRMGKWDLDLIKDPD
jgi:hypothetical protein